ncbi:MAG: hypothetical protein HYZ14_08085 [Bacteroidetes bacterium]|nr:hypothetical protein [Bacteroidota bacterium]
MASLTENSPYTAPSLHLVAFDVPYPPNYGGIVDVFYKLKSLHEAGVRIIYHCFYYRGHNRPNDELKKYCAEIYYYKRTKNLIRLIFGANPYVVTSRNHPDLLKNLCKTNDPIFFDGLQTCFYLNHPDLESRKKYVRANNIEHTYYRELAKVERNRLKRIYLDREADRLELFEPELKKADAIFAVAKMDLEHFETYSKTLYVPPFFNTDHARKEVNKSGIKGRFVLFQGNLRIRENELAAKFIINEVAPLTNHKIVIAGKSPSTWLKNEASIQENVQLIDTPPAVQMDSLIQYAHINLLITFQQTGIKLKLLHALDSGKHIIINSKMDDSGVFAELCYVKDTAENIAAKIDDLMKVEFTEQMALERHSKFSATFDNRRSARRIIETIFGTLL